ncbi:MAG TPA: carboxypeptidase regulatory-like domain-containing protein [Gemmatimonadaceae bacterium]|nr:carboxypeptidase regulatory-like domain-containing protein [Gemmatimonadaceae bacterium]
MRSPLDLTSPHPATRFRSRAFRALALLGFTSMWAAGAAAQSTAEIIRGRVFGPDSLPVAQAEVLVTGLVTRSTQTARSDAKGVYTIVFSNPESDYVVAVRKIGYASTTFRLSRTGISNMLGADVHLERASATLDTITVRATRPLRAGEQAAVGEINLGAVADSLFLADPSKLMSLLMSIPGVFALDDSTYSVLGAAANQNTTTIDGANVRGGALPPDAVASTRVITTSADPARGGFAGGSVAQTLRGGTDIFASVIRGSGADRSLAWDDPAWTRPIPRQLAVSGTANGPIRKQRLRYNVSWNVNDNSAEWYSLLAPRGPLLAQQGISTDSVAAVTAALRGLDVPLAPPSFPGTTNARNYSTAEVLDYTPTGTTSIRLSHSGNWSRNLGSNSSLTAFPTRSNDVGSGSHYVGARVTGYVHGLLDELSFNVNHYADHSDPFMTLPSGSVRIGTEFSDGRTGLSSLGFGGGQGNYYESTNSGDVTNEFSWLPKSGKHKVKAGGRLAFDDSRYFYFPTSNLLGSYSYLSIADLIANKPASYERVLTNTPRYTRARNSSAWVGDEWVASEAWQVQGGLRLDFAHPSTTPRYNPDVDRVFGLRTDRIPDDVGISPRLGFSWTSNARRGKGTKGGAATLGGIPASAIAAMSPELVTSVLAMQRSNTLPGISVNGSIGGYRGGTSTSAIADLVESTGLPGTRLTLSCVGAAVPIPDWSTMTEGPTACADGTTGTTFSLARPLVKVFDPAYRPPLSWRGNLGVDGIRVPHRWIMSLSTVFAYNVNGQSTIDLNLNRAPQFTLTGEGDRPFYAPLAAIVPASGAVSPGASRISPEFSTVSSTISDLRGYNAQLSASLAPPNPLFRRRVSLSMGYTLAAGRSEARGSSRVGTTGDPFGKYWVPGSQPTHSLRFTASGRVWWFNFGVTSFLYSGIPLTPLVSGDVNGDGVGNNDRAFIPDPATTRDTSLARQLNELIAHAPSTARSCITSQLGRMAGANSCHTPWQARLDLTASITPPSSWNYNDRFRITIGVMNASGALVRALGLEETPFGQTSLSTTPNATLFYVTGFDPDARQFKYRVNQLFGQPSNYGSARRRFGPTQLQLGAEYKFGGPMLNPIARGLGLREGANKPPLTDDERRLAVAGLKRDPATRARTTLRDALALTAEQQSELDALSTEYSARADSALTPLEKWVLKKGTRIFDQDLTKRLSTTQSALSKLNTEFGKRVQEVLTAEQQAKLK